MRPPEVFVGPLAHAEAVQLKRRSKAAKHFSTRQRAAILLASNTRTSAADIAHVADRRVARAQGDPRLQRAGARLAGP